MEVRLLEWVKVIGPIIISWPIVIIVFFLVFRKSLLELIKRFTETPESTAEIGPLKIQLGKSIVPPQHSDIRKQEDFEKIDLSETIGEIGDTGPEGTTVGFSLSYAMQAAILSKTGEKIVLSPRSIYVTAQKYDEWAGQKHEGTSLIGALNAMEKAGAYLETDWPYSNKAKPKPGKKPSYRIAGYKKVVGVERIANELRDSKVVVAAVTVTEDFHAADNEGKVVIRLPLASMGAKTICLVGFDEKNAEFKFANDWGSSWGVKGFGVIRDTDLSKILIDAYILEV